MDGIERQTWVDPLDPPARAHTYPVSDGYLRPYEGQPVNGALIPASTGNMPYPSMTAIC